MLSLSVLLVSLSTMEVGGQSGCALRLIFDFQQHPLITIHFKKVIEREVRATLARRWDHKCKLEISRTHRLMDEVNQLGWAALDRPLSVRPEKTCLIRVRFRANRYEVQLRMVDGPSGLTLPLQSFKSAVRPRLPDRIARAVDQDMALGGIIRQTSDAECVIDFTDTETIGRIRPGDVFAISRIQRSRDGSREGYVVPSAFLQATTIEENRISARLHHRFKEPLSRLPGHQEFRAVRMSTTSGILRLRIVNDEDDIPLASCQVIASAYGFDNPNVMDLGLTDENGRVESTARFQHLAFVKIIKLGQPIAQTPVPILGHDLPTEVRVVVP